MDGYRPFQPHANIGHETSVDVVRKQIYSVTSYAGQKRKLDISDTDADSSTLLLHPRVRHDAFDRELLPRNALTASKILNAFPEQHLEALSNTATGAASVQLVRAVTQTALQDPFLSLAHPIYQLPHRLSANFASLGVNWIYDWQKRCLTRSGLLDGTDNLVYTAPTGGGKSLVADVLLLKKIIQNPAKKAIVVLPFVALVQEKLRWYRKLLEGVTKCPGDLSATPAPSWKQPHTSSVRVAGFFGGSRAMVRLADLDIAICTIEKANSLVNTALEDGTVDQLGVVIVDEFHMIDDEHRGYLIELMITKLLCLPSGIQDRQIIGMSATLSVRAFDVSFRGLTFSRTSR